MATTEKSEQHFLHIGETLEVNIRHTYISRDMAGTDSTVGHRRSSYFSSCMSPSCVLVHEEYYSRIHDDQLPTDGDTGPRRRWQRIIKKIVRESKSIYGSTKPPTTFQYDAVSYSQNFDEGCHREEFNRCNPQVLRVREVRLRKAYTSDFAFSKV